MVSLHNNDVLNNRKVLPLHFLKVLCTDDYFVKMVPIPMNQ